MDVTLLIFYLSLVIFIKVLVMWMSYRVRVSLGELLDDRGISRIFME